MPFDSKSYLNRRYQSIKSSEENTTSNYFHDKISEIFNLSNINGDWLLDIGTGPSMHTTFYSSRKYKNIVLTDIDSTNRDELIKWLTNHKESYNWSEFSNYAAKKETSNCEIFINGEFIEQRAKEAVRAVVPIDVHKENPLDSSWFQKFDCLLSNLCLESASNDSVTYDKAIKNIKSLLKQNGYLIVAGVLEETFWLLGEKKLPSCFLKIENVEEIFKSNGFDIIHEDKLYFERKNFQASDSKGYYTIVGQLK